MRVIAGTARSLPLKTPASMDTRPTTDRIKETLFNMIQMDIPGCIFADFFAGSGGIGIEALSRGAEHSYFIENSNEEELIILLKKYIYDDLIRQFEDMLNSRRLQLHISENANDKFIELIDKISYTQILTLCNRVAVFFSDKVLTGNMSKSMAKNAALLNVSKFYDRAIQSDWTINHAEICHIGKELQFFIERILNKKTTILKDIASAENLRKWKNLEKDYNRQTAYAEE